MVVGSVACHCITVLYLLMLLVVESITSLPFVIASLNTISSSSNGLVVSELDCCLAWSDSFTFPMILYLVNK